MTKTWVDNLHIQPLAPSLNNDNNDTTLSLTIASFNILAESYLSPRSHPNLPPSYSNVVFDNEKRRALLVSTLERFCCPPNDAEGDKIDILALQELDLLDEAEGGEVSIVSSLKSWGYEIVTTPTEDRRDCCAVVYDSSKFRLKSFEVVRFDDLATLYAGAGVTIGASTDASVTQTDTADNKGSSRGNNPNSELTGMVRSFLRRNYAILAHLETINTTQSILVASVHLYWHPGYEYVKLCQSKYLLDRAYAMATTTSNGMNSNADGDKGKDVMPTIICGDMNSKPQSIVHQFFTQGSVDGRSVAPWRYFWNGEEQYQEKSGGDRLDGQDLVRDSFGGGDTGSFIEGDIGDTNGGFNSQVSELEQFQFCQVIDPDTNNNPKENSSQHESPDSKIELQPSQPSLKSNETMPTNNSSPEQDINSNELQAISARRMQLNSPQDYQHLVPTPGVKYMLDFTLNRFTRWLRILGIDARLETDEEEKERTKGQRIALFEHCKKEGRTLLTTSYKLLLRKDCPPGAYLLDTKSISHLEQHSLPRLLRTHGVELSPRIFLTRCVVCNGHIHAVSSDEEKCNVFVEHGAPDLCNVKETMEVFRCDGCRQGYWWDDRPSSSASRVFVQATKLFRLCLRGGVGIKDYKEKKKEVMGAFDFVDVEKERGYWDESKSGQDLAVVDWLREEKLVNPFRLRSAYCVDGGANDSSLGPRESLPFSNVTSDFVGLLDYVFFDQNKFEQVGRINVPTSFRELNTSSITNGHLIPSDIWPSDHLVVGARLRLKQPGVKKNTAHSTSKQKPLNHQPRCQCGCVPNILSLLEMAELRKKAREAAKAKQSTN